MHGLKKVENGLSYEEVEHKFDESDHDMKFKEGSKKKSEPHDQMKRNHTSQGYGVECMMQNNIKQPSHSIQDTI